MTDFLPPTVLRLQADISDYIAKLAEADAALQAFIHNASGHLDNAAASFKADGQRAGRAIDDGVSDGAKDTGDRVARDVSNQLRNARGQFVAAGVPAGAAVGDGIGNGLRMAASIASGALSALTFAAIPSLIGAAAQLAPVISASAAALAAIPAAATFAAGGLLSLGLGFHGISSAISAVFQPAMGGASQSINQVAQAERALTQAQRNAIATQDALNAARKAAAQNIKDLAIAMSGAKLQVEEATLAVTDAQNAYRTAVGNGNPDMIYRTNLALREAQQRLTEVQDSAEKTAAAQADANTQGVEGSQQVKSALNAQLNATDAVTAATEALAQAQKQSSGGANALATAMAALAPSARAVVQEIQRLKPALHDIQQTVQQHMFAGLARDLDKLAHAWLPGARVGLTGLADDFNRLFRGLTQSLASQDMVRTLSGLFGSLNGVLGQFAGLAPNLVQAFGDMVRAATPFLKSLGEAGAGGLKNFLDWIDKLSKNGTLDQFFTTALQTLKAFGGMVKDAGSIITSVFNAMGAAGGFATGAFGPLLRQVAEFLKSAQGMEALKGIFSVLGQLASGLASNIGPLLAAVAPAITALAKALGPIIGLLAGEFLPVVVQLISKLAEALLPVISALAPALLSVLAALTPLISMLGSTLGDILVAIAPYLALLATVLGEVLTQALTALTPLFAQLLPVLVTLVRALIPPLIPLVQLLARVFTALMPALVPLIELLVDILVPILKLLVPIIGLLTPVIQSATDVLVMIITPIAAFIGWLAKALDSASMWKAVGKWFTDLWREITGAFNDGVQWIGKKWDEMIDFARSIPGRILDAVGDLGSLLVNTGKNIVIGLWNGLVGMGDWLMRRLTDWIKAVIPGPIAKVLGIASPSKVAAELARWVPLGLAQGMDSATDAVTAAAARLANAMLPTVGGAPGWAVPSFATPGAPPIPAIGVGLPGRIVIENHVHSPVYLDGKLLHAGMIGPAQQYKARTGTTGLV